MSGRRGPIFWIDLAFTEPSISGSGFMVIGAIGVIISNRQHAWNDQPNFYIFYSNIYCTDYTHEACFSINACIF